MRLAAWLWLGGCASQDYTRLYFVKDKADSLSWDDIEALDHLGPTLVDRGVNFSVYAANAERVEILLFDDPESDRPTQQFPLTQYGEVWNLYIEGVGEGQHYGYVAWGPNWTHDERFYPGSVIGFRADVDEAGNRYNPNKLLIDPYTKVVHRDHDWGRGSAASGPHNDQPTYGAAAKSVVVSSSYEWQDESWREARMSGEHPGHGPADLVIYEVHVKGFSMSSTSNQWGIEHFGTYRGLGEGASYLADLGITAVELMPIHEKPLDGGYWGYNNLSWFAPEVSMSSAWQDGGEPVEIVDEFKWMVDQLHAAGIEVIVDVVYNHTGEGGLWRTKLFYDDPDGDWQCDPASAVNLDSQEVASLLSWRGLDSAEYYVLENANQGYYDGSTGVGNQVRANARPGQRMILDSLHYMVEELHVDGFRFDLAAVLGEPDGEAGQYWTLPTDTTLNAVIDDPVLKQYHTRIIAEPWSTAYDGSTQYPMSAEDPSRGWGEWNANFRDWWRSFLNDDAWPLNARQGAVDFGGVMTGSYDRYAWSGKQPYHTVNFVTAHDGFTMFDLFSYPEKENGCGPLNPVCCNDTCSSWCDPTSGESNNHSRSWSQGSDESLKRQMMRNAFVGLMLSQGTPMMLGGDEWMRTQYGNNNAYSAWADNEWNWFRWGEWTSQNRNNVFRHRMHDFVRQLIELRKRHPAAFAPEDWEQGVAELQWLAPSGGEAQGENWASRNLALLYGGEDPILLLFNLEQGPVTFTLPSSSSWGMVIDTQSYYDLPGRSGEPTGWFDENPDADPFQSKNVRIDDPLPVSGSYTVQPRSIVVMESM
jgi:isoamylase